MAGKKHGTRPAYSAWNVDTEIDEKGRQFIVRVPFAADELPYYPVLVAALIAGRSATSMYNALTKNIFGIAEQAAEIEGVAHIHHKGLLSYINRRNASAEEQIKRKKATLERIKKSSQRPKKRPNKPKPVTASQSAEQVLDSGVLDFLDGLADDD